MAGDAVRLRLLHTGGEPISHEGQAWVFGLQNTKGELFDGHPMGDGLLAFDFDLRVKPGPDAERPTLLGDFASGPAQARFVYLSWQEPSTGAWINRLKARLQPITWAMVHDAQALNRPITASMAGRQLGDARPPTWRVG